MFIQRKGQDQDRRRGAAAVMVVVTIPVLIGMAALTVDVAVMFNTRADLQRSADAAAMAGASSLLSDAMLRIRLGTDDGSEVSEITTLANVRAAAVGALNPSLGTETTTVDGADIQIGYLDLTSGTSVLVPNPGPPEYLNAVQVTVRRSADGPNGSVGLFFAPIFGRMSTEITASAVAAFDNRVVGLPDVSGGWLMPFTVDKENYEQELALGIDNYMNMHDEGVNTVGPGSDGIPEANLYPVDSGPGNFGLLNIPHTSPQSTVDIVEQIENGVSEDDLIAEIGDSEFTFEDEWGDPITYTMEGTAGLEAALKSSLDVKAGDVIGFLLHDKSGIMESGANLMYPIVELRFGRVLDTKLVGGNKYIWIQPAVFSGGGLRLDITGPGSLHDTAGLVVLAR